MTNPDKAVTDEEPANWDSIAKQYSEWLNGNLGIVGKATTEIVRNNVLAIINNLRERNVLDLGCGEGYLAREMSSKGAQVSAMDSSPTMIDIARSKSSSYQIQFSVGDITNDLPYKSGEFDIVVCNMVLMDIADIGGIFKEVNRVLKPGATFVFSIVHPCFSGTLGNWIDLETSTPSLRFKRRYISHFKDVKHIFGLTQGVLVAHYHRPIQDYIKLILENDLSLSDFIETSVTKQYMETIDSGIELMRYYLTASNLIISATKPLASIGSDSHYGI